MRVHRMTPRRNPWTIFKGLPMHPHASLRCSAYVLTLLSCWPGLPGSAVLAQATGEAAGTGKVIGYSAPSLSELEAGSASELVRFIERYSTDRAALRRLGYAEVSPRHAALRRSFLEQWRQRLATVNFDTLGQDGRIDYILMRNHLEYESRQIEIDAKSLEEMSSLIPFAEIILNLDERRLRNERVDAPGAATALDQLVRRIDATRAEVEEALKAGPERKGEAGGEGEVTAGGDEAAAPEQGAAPPTPNLKKTVANRAAGAVDDLRRTLRGWHGFYSGYDPVFTWWLDEPYKAADKALTDYAAFLRQRVVGIRPGDESAIIGDPIGREALLSDLAMEMIPYSPEELIEIANKEFAWCEAEMLKASRDLGYGDDWHAALEHVKTLHVAPGEQPELIRELAHEAIDFLEERGLVTIPDFCKVLWRIEMMSPQRQLITPFFTGGEVISVAFPTASMTHEQKMMSLRGNNRHFARATVHHELIPGHHLQGYMTARHNTHRSVFGTPFWTEGWALYWEMLLWDLDFQRSPEDRIGMLFWRSHRCARIIFSLGFHLEQMTPQECIDFLVDRVGHERENATAEVRRSVGGQYSPLYQCAYMLGGLQFRALHRDLVQTGKMTDREFHDAILRMNRIPVEMIRAHLEKLPLRADYAPEWRFYGE